MNGFEILRGFLEGSVPGAGPVSGEPIHAAVCVIVAGPTHFPSILFIRRAKVERDPWSEHIALPGGLCKTGEALITAVRREVEEEVGIAIDERALTPLPQLHIRLAGTERLLLLNSFVFFAGEILLKLQCGPEIESAFWVPVAYLWDADNLDCLELGDKCETLVYPAIRLPQGIMFGITFRVITLLSDRLGIPLRYLEEIPLLRRQRE
jgi:8-oxo-dGTP pyrophosphatase MutT (NUDIX family)